MTVRLPARPGYRLVFSSVITLKNGKRLYARDYGRTAWAFYVPV
jgi:hypothetical protein